MELKRSRTRTRNEPRRFKTVAFALEAWRREYNESRPHRALANRTPEEFASQIAVNRDLAETKTSRFLTL
jgi:transposase InsO family protein